ncbi:MAG: LLM class flavin-dependent oxidoreductase [Myxococcota bacterium]
MTRPSFGFTLPQRGMFFGITTPERLLAAGVEAERSGLFDSVWVGDSLTAKPRPESVVLLGALAGKTERVRLGVACMASFPVRDPLVFAYQWATLDAFSGGRAQLAACTGLVAGGLSKAEGEVWGVPDRERAARLEENIEICRLLWSGDRTSFSGKFTSFEDLSIVPKPVQDPCPIWIAANPAPRYLERSMQRVARLADGWMTVQRFPGAFAECWAQLRKLLAEQGRDSDSFPTAAYHNINIGSDRTKCLDESERFLTEYYGPVFNRAAVEAWTAAGSPEECVKQLEDLAREGAKHITLRITGWDQEEQFERLRDEVLPAVGAVGDAP